MPPGEALCDTQGELSGGGYSADRRSVDLLDQDVAVSGVPGELLDQVQMMKRRLTSPSCHGYSSSREAVAAICREPSQVVTKCSRTEATVSPGSTA